MLLFHKIDIKLFYTFYKEDWQTRALFEKIVVEVATCILEELCDPKKEMLDYLTAKLKTLVRGILPIQSTVCG